MTKIEKAVRTVSDLYDFYRRIPKPSPAPSRAKAQNKKRKPPSP